MKMSKRVKKIIAAALCAALLVGTVLAAGLNDGDSLISLSYLQQFFISQTVESGYKKAETALDAVYQEAEGALDRMAEEYLAQAGVGQTGGYSDRYARRTLSVYDVLVLESGSGIIVEAGSLKLTHSGTVVDVTIGQTVPSECVLTAGHRYLAAEETQAQLTVESDAARVAVEGVYFVTPGGQTATPFTDITIHQWYRDAVNRAYSMGLFAGTGDGSLFAPEVKLDRAMMMTVLFHLAGDPDEERFAATVTFPDVPAGEWYESYVRWAGQQGIGAGYGDGAFRPLNTMTRREVVQFLYNFGRSYLKLDLNERADLSGYEGIDILRADGWGEEAMSWAAAAEIISELRPNDCPGRGEVAGIVAAFAEKYL
ncbi:MAG: S-layer homology domain-containing protein [Oscillospiraceae bacterium]|nr:S-layer homology domain-containing protein [Oscillospiraceae bacterium]